MGGSFFRAMVDSQESEFSSQLRDEVAHFPLDVLAMIFIN